MQKIEFRTFTYISTGHCSCVRVHIFSLISLFVYSIGRSVGRSVDCPFGSAIKGKNKSNHTHNQFFRFFSHTFFFSFVTLCRLWPSVPIISSRFPFFTFHFPIFFSVDTAKGISGLAF